MTTLLPTRVSIYDFLLEDTQPIDALMADLGHTSLAQARILIENGIQAIVSALLAYHQHQGAEAVLKKLLQRNQVKQVRQYNAFNLNTMLAMAQFSSPVCDTLFHNAQSQKQVCQQLAQLAQLSDSKVKPVLAALTLLCLRELAILADFAQLDSQEIDIWLQQQPQFLLPSRGAALSAKDKGALIEAALIENDLGKDALAKNAFVGYDDNWHLMTGYVAPIAAATASTPPQSMPHYAKAIGRLQPEPQNSVAAQNKVTGNAANVIDSANSNTVLTFALMPGIHLPYQRWLLQLAKIADIYLSRQRLKIAPEPQQPPSRPLVSFGFIEESTTTTASETPIEYDKPPSFWRNPAILLILAVIGTLALLAIGKYQYKQFIGADFIESEASSTAPPSQAVAKDIAIVRITDSGSDSDNHQTSSAH